mmetsp:Transcript_13468/g.31350  ORF Transcript_13468/g.31350 Transcript_13468/m.31350 type:complete len:354 (-) Transcript_13468:657-1718(-)
MADGAVGTCALGVHFTPSALERVHARTVHAEVFVMLEDSGVDEEDETFYVQWFSIHDSGEEPLLRSVRYKDHEQGAKKRKEGMASGFPLRVATRFLHESGEIRHFNARNTDPVLADTVYINLRWIIDVLKGLFHHDRSPLLAFFSEPKMQRRVLRMVTFGVIHRELLPYLWPCLPGYEDYWAMIRAGPEGDAWSRTVVSSWEDVDKCMALFGAFDLTIKIPNTHEYMAPCLLGTGRKRLIDANAFSEASAMLRVVVQFNSLPPGFLARVFLRGMREFEHVDFNHEQAAMYSLGHSVAIFSRRLEATDCWEITLQATNGACLNKAGDALTKVKEFFPGMFELDAWGLQRSKGGY